RTDVVVAATIPMLSGRLGWPPTGASTLTRMMPPFPGVGAADSADTPVGNVQVMTALASVVPAQVNTRVSGVGATCAETETRLAATTMVSRTASAAAGASKRFMSRPFRGDRSD